MKTLFFLIIFVVATSGSLSAKDSTETTWRFPVWYSPSDVDYVFGLTVGTSASDKVLIKSSYLGCFGEGGARDSVASPRKYITGFSLLLGNFENTSKYFLKFHDASISVRNYDRLDYKEAPIINGIKFSIFNSDAYIINGIDIGVTDYYYQLNGISFNLIYSNNRISNGLKIASILSQFQELNGISVSLINYGGSVNGVVIAGLLNYNNISDTINGLQIGILNFGNVNGSQFGLINFSKISNGINISGTHSNFLEINGVNLSLAFLEGKFLNGLSISTIHKLEKLNGLIFGALNESFKVNGMLVGVYNSTNRINGVQIGLFNWADKLNGFQIGIINRSEDRWMPIINWGF